MERTRSEGSRPATPSSFGTGRLVLRCPRFTVSTVTLPAGLTLPPHAHRHDQLGVVLAGQYEETRATGAVTLRAGSVVWRRGGELHGNVVGARRAEVLLVDLRPTSAEQLCLAAVQPAAYFAPDTFPDIHHGLVQELGRADPAARVAIEGWVCLLAARTGRCWPAPQAVEPVWLSHVVALIHAAYPRRLRLARLAAAAGVHPVTVAARFRRHFGKSVGAYLRDLRIARARRDLERSPRALAAIALEAGFYDESHMDRVFRRRLGVTPGALRSRSREAREALSAS